VFRAIYDDPSLQRYSEPVVPAIHIIVDNGTVTLNGVVATQSDKTEAYLRAMSVPGTFGVNNDIEVNPAS
jgi:hyperosmotically inducible periplasmic protein